MKKNYILQLTVFILLLTGIKLVFANEKLDFEKKLNYYLDINSSGFLKKLGVKEQFLLQTIQNLAEEINSRGYTEQSLKELGFSNIFKDYKVLLEEYSMEVNNILNLMTEIEKLENYVVSTENRKMLGEIQQLKENLKTALDNRQDKQKKRYSKEDAIHQVQGYTTELDSILNVYDFLIVFEEKAQAQNDTEILAEIEKQKRRLIKIIGNYSPQGDSLISQQMARDYLGESDKIVAILKEIDHLSGQTDSSKQVQDAKKVKEELFNAVDRRLLELAGYRASSQAQGPALSEYLREWRAQKTADYHARLTQYRIIYTRLLSTGNESERERMLERAMKDAVLNYSAREYDLAELQFGDIMRNFSPYFSNLDGVLFYIGESNYAQSYYDAALEQYDKLIKDYPKSSYYGQALWKCLMICYTYDWGKKFFQYYEKLNAVPQDQSSKEVNGAHYLAGYLYASMGSFAKARQLLMKVEQGSQYYHPAQYTLGIVYVNLDNYNRARKIFETLADEKSYSSKDANTTALRNEATIRLGFLHFQRGEYSKAIEILEKVSQRSEQYDQGLMVQAWANLKSGNYEQSIDKVKNLLSQYMSSNHSYEALVLSAHCKEILNKPEEAKKDLRYVTAAHGVMKLHEEYNKERKRILDQARELERIEADILDRHDEALYQESVKIRQTINEALMGFSLQGFSGNQLLDEFNDERKEILRQIQQLDALITQNKESGQKELVEMAEKQRARLINVLETQGNTRPVNNINYFVDHPLATKEGGIKYRRGLMKDMFEEILTEKKRLERDIQAATEILAKKGT
ncbi:tetratricopeptide repeat protein, partial [candidate division KSB1 bacterium]|nr:tetratricopeptide repeat protein [candidate division KSB1 bacterium]